MQSVKWLSFCASNTVTRTVAHFFPCAGNVAAPYPVSCRLEVFGQGIGRKNIMIDGARLSQPDGVRLEDAFSALQQGVSGFLGIEIQLATNQPRVDLAYSSCVIELSSRGSSCRFWPQQQFDAPKAQSSDSMVVIKDALTTTSLVVVNAQESVVKPQLLRRHNGEVVSVGGMTPTEIPAWSATEVVLGESFFDAMAPCEYSGGLLRAESVWVGQNALGVAYYIMYRDALTKKPISVFAL